MPEARDSLLLEDTNHSLYNALVLLICGDLPASTLHLQQLDPLDGLCYGLGDGCGHSTFQKSLMKDTESSVMLKGKRRQATAVGTGWDLRKHILIFKESLSNDLKE